MTHHAWVLGERVLLLGGLSEQRGLECRSLKLGDAEMLSGDPMGL